MIDEFARYLEKADLASDVRDRELRVRVERLLVLAED